MLEFFLCHRLLSSLFQFVSILLVNTPLLVDAIGFTASIDASLSINPSLILDPATRTDEGSCFAMLFFATG